MYTVPHKVACEQALLWGIGQRKLKNAIRQGEERGRVGGRGGGGGGRLSQSDLLDASFGACSAPVGRLGRQQRTPPLISGLPTILLIFFWALSVKCNYYGPFYPLLACSGKMKYIVLKKKCAVKCTWFYATMRLVLWKVFLCKTRNYSIDNIIQSFFGYETTQKSQESFLVLVEKIKKTSSTPCRPADILFLRKMSRAFCHSLSSKFVIKQIRCLKQRDANDA